MKLTTRRRALCTVAAGTLLSVTACGGSDEPTEPAAALATATSENRLAGSCPEDVVVQLQWQPQSDMGALFALLGPGYSVDTKNKSVSGPLVVAGENTGVRLTLKAGGPAIGFQSVTSQMYVDSSVDFGLVHSDQMIAAAGKQRVVGVTPLLKYSPAMLMWDPKTHPGLSLKTLAASGTAVVVSKDQIYPDWLVAKGLLKADQIDTSYDGNPARFVGDPGIVQQGFANSEPYTYEHDTPAWAKPVGYALLKDVGYDIYASNLTVRADRLQELSPCLKKLVPAVQRASADYISSPEATNKKIVDIVSKDSSYSPYTIGEADYSAALLKEKGLVANESDGSVGTYDMARVTKFLGELAPVIRDRGGDVPTTISEKDLFTDDFTDHSIGIK